MKIAKRRQLRVVSVRTVSTVPYQASPNPRWGIAYDVSEIDLAAFANTDPRTLLADVGFEIDSRWVRGSA